MVASVQVSGRRFRDGELPEVCAHSGRRADRLYRLDADRIPPWMWLLILFGVVPFLVAMIFRSRAEPGWIPLRAASAAQLRAYRVAMLGFGLATILFVGIALIARQPVGLVLAVLTTVGWVGSAWRCGWHSPSARETGRGTIVLDNVHPDFVAALGDTNARVV